MVLLDLWNIHYDFNDAMIRQANDILYNNRFKGYHSDFQIRVSTRIYLYIYTHVFILLLNKGSYLGFTGSTRSFRW